MAHQGGIFTQVCIEFSRVIGVGFDGEAYQRLSDFSWKFICKIRGACLSNTMKSRRFRVWFECIFSKFVVIMLKKSISVNQRWMFADTFYQ